MKDAKNMDSVFSNCTDDELMFDILFDDDETIIEALAGSDVMSKLLAEGLLEEGDDMVGENPDFDYQNDGDASYSEKDAEGTKEVKPEIGGEVGDGKEVSGKENSAEANAHDDKDEAEAIGLNDKQQVKLEDAAEGPLEDDDQAEREGEVSDTAIETEATAIDTILAMLDEAEDPIQDCDDSAQRDGKCTGVSDTEGKNTEVIGAANAGDSKEDPIEDPKCPNDGDVRAGADTGVKDTEGVKTHVVGAALESSEEPEDKEEEVEESMTISDELLSMLEADEEEAEEGAPEEDIEEGVKNLVKSISEKYKSRSFRDKIITNTKSTVKETLKRKDINVSFTKGATNIHSIESFLSGKSNKFTLSAKVYDIATKEDKEKYNVKGNTAASVEKVAEAIKKYKSDIEKAVEEKIGLGVDVDCSKVVDSLIHVLKLDVTIDFKNINESFIAFMESEDPITDKDDADSRAGKNTGVSDTEGKNTEVLGASIVGDVNSDPLVDLDDAEQRDGKAVDNDTEGVKTHVVGAALESSLSDELLSMLEADEEEPEEGAPEEPTDEKSCKEGAEEADKPEDVPEQSTEEKCCNEADEYLDSLLKDIDDEDEDLIAAIAGGAAVVPNDVKTNGTDNSDIKEAADKISDELIDDQDDNDIEAIEGEKIPAEDPNIDYDYDDDELIDAVINGIDL